jgi:hypothetical protein
MLAQYATYVIYFTAGFMLIPTGRDFFAPGKAIMPGDDKLLAAMNRDALQKPCSAFMWKVFGCNFVFLSIIKFMTLASAAGQLATLFAIHGTIAVSLLIFYKKGFDAEGADITPFLGLFVLETIAWYILVLGL